MTALIVFAGRPGTGKTTLSRLLAQELGAAVFRIDVIEAAVVRSGPAAHPVGAIGYEIARDLAADCLGLCTSVVVDAVNSVPEARQIWTQLAAEAAVPLHVIEVALTDADQHRRRVELRRSDVPGLVVPTWEQVLTRDYQPWDDDRDGPRLLVDGAAVDPAMAAIRDHIGIASPPR